MTHETLPEPVALFAQFMGEWRETTSAHAEPLYTAATLREAVKRAREEQDDLADVLLRNGFVRCDIAACNCGSWHARYGLPQRMEEIKGVLSDAGHPLCNENGNLVLNALKQLIAERDALRADAEAMIATLPGPYYMDMPDGGDVPPAEQMRRMAIDAARYRWLARKVSAHGVIDGWAFGFPTHLTLPAPALALRDPEKALGEAIDAAIDAARSKVEGEA